jgi:putative ABC transport system permease protein
MIRYYLLLFVRNLSRQRMFSFINLLGLTTGIVSTLLIYLYVQSELSHDQFHENGNRIYRVNETFIWGDDNNQLFSSTGPGVGVAIDAEIPEAEQVVRVFQPGGNFLMKHTDEKNQTHSFDESNILVADSNFFEVFTFPMITGNKTTALDEANAVVITASTAKKYFGDENALGKILQIDDFVQNEPGKALMVTGVIKDIPDNSYLKFDFMVSMNSLPRVKKSSWSWVWTMFETFVLLDEKASPIAVQEKLKSLPRKYAEATLQNAMGTTYDEYVKNGKQWNLYLQKFTDIHLHSGTTYNRLSNVGNITILYILVGIVTFIIVLSCINFMNLTTAQYTKRLKETSLRKVLGSGRWQLGASFFIEALLFCTIAVIVGIGLTQIALPYFNTISGNNYQLNITSDPKILSVILILLLVMSLLCGSYPAIFLSAFKPVEALKGKMKSGKEGKSLRNGLVVFQFAISLILIVCTMIVFQQLKYLSAKDVGFNRENLMIISRVEMVNDKQTFFNSLQQITGVAQASSCTSAPPKLFDGDSFQAEDHMDKPFSLNYVKADEDYVPTLDLKIAIGHNFRKDSPADINGVILNETAVKQLGWKLDDTVLGKNIFYPGDEQKFEVIGVVRDFNYWSLSAPIQAMAIFHIQNKLYSNNREFAALRIQQSDLASWQGTIAGIQKEWKQFAGDVPLQYEFVDDAFASTFENEEKFGQAMSIFAGLAILIASLGLLGMIIFTLELRTKEIGIRKVIGASEVSIVALVSKDYTKLIFIAILVSVPVSWWFMNQWLNGFLHRIEINPLTFVIAGVSTLIVAMIITSYHAIKAALTNPVDVLKDE